MLNRIHTFRSRELDPRNNNRDRLRLVATLAAITACGPLSIGMYLPAFPAIQNALLTDEHMVSATLVAYFIGLALGQSVVGPLSDKFGRMKPLIGGLCVYILMSLACAFAPNVESLISFRFVQALGGCAGMVISRAMVGDLFEEREIAKVFSMLMMIMGIAPILSPTIGGTLLQLFGWRAIFLFLAGFGATGLMAALLVLRDTLPEDNRSKGGVVEVLRAYVSFFTKRDFLLNAAVSASFMSVLFAYTAGSAFVFIEMFGLSPVSYSFVMAANSSGLMVASHVNGRMLSRYSTRAVLSGAVMVSSVAGIAVFILAEAGLGGIWGLLIPLFFALSCVGFINPNATAIAMMNAGAYPGAGAALIGVIQFSFAAVSGTAVGLLANGTSGPMTGIIATVVIAGYLLHWFAARRPSVPQ